MKKTLLLAIGLMWLAFPAVSHAANECFTDTLGSFYVLDIKSTCTKVTKDATVHGKVFFVNPEADCGGVGHIWPVTGTCFGIAAQNKVVIGFRVTAEGPGCVSQDTLVSGTSVNSALSGFTRFDGSSNTAITLTPAACSSAPSS